MAAKRKFSLDMVASGAKQAIGKGTPRVRDLELRDQHEGDVPKTIVDNFTGTKIVYAFDIETHDIIQENTSALLNGQYGFPARVPQSTIESLRIIQIGWAVGPIDCSEPATFLRYVQPEGFNITEAATATHRLTQKVVEDHGDTLECVLKDFMASVQDWYARGARMAAHQIEFDAGIIARELDRCGLHDLSAFWCEAVRAGVCTMDPTLCNWIRVLSGDGEAAGRPRTGPLGIKDSVLLMVPHTKELRQKHHAADKDAEMTWLLCKSIASRCSSKL